MQLEYAFLWNLQGFPHIPIDFDRLIKHVLPNTSKYDISISFSETQQHVVLPES